MEIRNTSRLQLRFYCFPHPRPRVRTILDPVAATIATSTAACVSADSPAAATSRAWTSTTFATQMNGGAVKDDLEVRRRFDDFFGHFGTECPALRELIVFFQLL